MFCKQNEESREERERRTKKINDKGKQKVTKLYILIRCKINLLEPINLFQVYEQEEGKDKRG